MKTNKDISRRKLLQSAALGGGATLIIGPQISLAGDEKPDPVREEPRSLSDFEEVLKRCGSEFGGLTEAS